MKDEVNETLQVVGAVDSSGTTSRFVMRDPVTPCLGTIRETRCDSKVALFPGCGWYSISMVGIPTSFGAEQWASQTRRLAVIDARRLVSV